VKKEDTIVLYIVRTQIGKSAHLETYYRGSQTSTETRKYLKNDPTMRVHWLTGIFSVFSILEVLSTFWPTEKNRTENKLKQRHIPLGYFGFPTLTADLFQYWCLSFCSFLS
jgi:hypothetical protein